MSRCVVVVYRIEFIFLTWTGDMMPSETQNHRLARYDGDDGDKKTVILPSSTTNYDAYDLHQKTEWLAISKNYYFRRRWRKSVRIILVITRRSTCQYYWEYFHTNDFEDDFFLSKLIYKDQRQLSTICLP